MTIVRSPIRLAAAALLSGLGACSQFETRFDAGYKEADAKALAQMSDLSEVLEKYGPPTRLGRAGEGVVLLYEGLTLRERQFGLSIAYDWLSFFKAVVAKGDADIDTLAFVFDGEGRVLSSAASNETRDIGYGGSVDLIFQAVPLVDTSGYTTLSPQHDWGHGLSEPLSVMLNAQNSITSGVGGVERLGTPRGVGQEALVFHR